MSENGNGHSIGSTDPDPGSPTADLKVPEYSLNSSTVNFSALMFNFFSKKRFQPHFAQNTI